MLDVPDVREDHPGARMLIRVVCACGASARAEVPDDHPKHVDPRAIAMQAVARHGWQYRDGRIAKSTVTMTCSNCRMREGAPLHLDADIDPSDAVPATHEEDLKV